MTSHSDMEVIWQTKIEKKKKKLSVTNELRAGRKRKQTPNEGLEQVGRKIFFSSKAV